MIIYDEPNETYHANPAFSSSEGKLALQDLRLLGDYRQGILPQRSDSKAMFFGSAVHCQLLEPEAFADRYAVKPEGLNLTTKAGREWKAEHEGIDILSMEDLRAIEFMVDRLCPAVREILEDEEGKPEVTIRVADDGLPLQCRLDWWRPSAHAIHDLKTTARFGNFVRGAFDLHYAFSCAWYCHVYHLELGVYPTFDFLVVESVPPYRSAVFTPTDAFLAFGRSQLEEVLPKLREAHASGDYPSECPERVELDLPRFINASAFTEDAEFLI
jgi:exodeoxyribonuclease VIII